MSGNGEIARDVLTGRLEALEGPALCLVELPAADGGLDLLIYDERGALVDVSYVPAELVGATVREPGPRGATVIEQAEGSRPAW
jgi:hypothetical protein